MNRCVHILWHVLLGVAIVAGVGGIVMFLWNGVVRVIFGVAAISFWQALGILVLCRILFGSFGHGRWLGGGAFHKNPIRAKWEQMTPEERKDFIGRHHHHYHHPVHEEPEKKD
ncbi:MAG: hypothetical protein LBB84_01410 [Tannerellaceae bacterium]|jgi:hypothetical protein|nr:hypothetical protein [Tannerellaceae bacterium]